MDILNFISWIRGKRQVTTVDPAKTVIPLGIKDGRRDDDYLTVAMTVEDFAAQITPEPAYKVYTALLTQSGGDAPTSIYSGELIIGATYSINDNFGSGWDFTNVGAPNNDLYTSFVATGTTPNSWGIDGQLDYNAGAPVVTVLENTIGNIWFTYDGIGSYTVKSNGLFLDNKSFVVIGDSFDGGQNGAIIASYYQTSNDIFINTGVIDFNSSAIVGFDELLYKTPIEIRVYN